MKKTYYIVSIIIIFILLFLIYCTFLKFTYTKQENNSSKNSNTDYEKNYNIVIKDHAFDKYVDKVLTYDELKEMLLLYPDNTESLVYESVLDKIIIHLQVSKDIDEPYGLHEPKKQILELLNNKVNKEDLYKITLEEDNVRFKIEITNNFK